MATTVTNTTIDTYISDNSLTLTRVTDAEALPVTPNSNIRLKFTITGTNLPVWLTYDELQIAGIRDNAIRQANSRNTILDDIETKVDDLANLIDTYTGTYTYAEYAAVIEAVRDIDEAKGV